MSGRGFSKNNVIAGAFVLVSVALAVVASVVISGAAEMFQARTDYVVRFSLADGAAGLKAGSAINAGGQPVGRVRSVRVAVEDKEPVGIDAVISVRSDMALHEDAYAYLESPILGGVSTINIPRVGVGAPLKENQVIPGRLAPPSALAQAGYGPDQAEQVRQIIKNAHEVAERIDRATARAERELDQLLEAVRSGVEDFRAVAADVRERSPAWTANVDTVLEKAAHAAAELDTAVADARGRLAEVRAAFDRNRPQIDGAIDSIRSAAKKIDEESVPLVNETLAAGRDGAGQFQSLAARVEAFLAEESPSLRRTIGNFRLAADQIKLAAIEIRTKPWLLLYTPKTKELESDTLYSAARSYASAVSDLRAASASLEVAANNEGTPLSDRESMESMQARLREAFAEYEKAEQALLDKLIKARKGG